MATTDPRPRPTARVLIAIPVYNEAATVAGVVQKVRTFAEDVLLVDDGSTDGTPAILDQLARETGAIVSSTPINQGYGQALIRAFNHAESAGFDWVITMDCDEQHEPESLPAFFEAIAQADQDPKNPIDIISGSRYLDLEQSAVGAPPADRRRINGLITEELNARLGSIFGTTLTDAFCGFKAHRVRPAIELGLTETGYAFPMQLWARAAAAGLQVRELPVRLIYTDPNRTFGGDLDEATRRLTHYRTVLHRELCKHADQLPGAASQDLLVDCSQVA